MSFLDTNVLLDILGVDPVWSDWSKDQLRHAADRGDRLVIDGIVYAELGAGFAEKRALDEFLQAAEIAVAPIPRPVFFRAGQAFATYRRRSSTRSSILPDFIIGAHAAELEVPLVTRDPRRYRAYFPDLELITP